ncbi:DNA-directed RNA polymerase subunit beta [Lacticaseibacillus saniviri]|uniref:DNA-directed RNA polymerase subunit beta n=1 Tax=Lacticaseibacillus saniviri TaxID=931533 RepID=UPI0039BE3593
MSSHYAGQVLKKVGWGLLFALIVLLIGLMVGYGVGGGNPLKIFLPSTWGHIFDFLH